MPLRYRDGVIVFQTAPMSGSEDSHTTHLTEPQNQTVKDKAISMTEDDSSLSPSDSLRRRRDVEDVDDEITQ